MTKYIINVEFRDGTHREYEYDNLEDRRRAMADFTASGKFLFISQIVKEDK